MKALCKVPTIPHKKFLVGRDGFNGVEVDVHPVLTGSQVLLPGRVSWIHVAHPVTFLLIKAIDEVVEFLSGIDLSKREERCSVEKQLAQSQGKLPQISQNKHRQARQHVGFQPSLPS